VQTRNAWSVYEIRCVPTGEVYIGVTCTRTRRIEQHFESSSNPGLRRAVQFYGRAAFRTETVEKHPKMRAALSAEKGRINAARCAGVELFNLTDGGEHPWKYQAPKQKPWKLKRKHARGRSHAPSPRGVPYQNHVQYAHDVVLARRAARRRMERAQGIGGDGSALSSLLRHVRNLGDAAYGGTDRMTPAEQAAWAQTTGPVLRMAELEWRIATPPRQWPDYAQWERAYGRTARRLARR